MGLFTCQQNSEGEGNEPHHGSGSKTNIDMVNTVEAAHNEWIGLRFFTKGRVDAIQHNVIKPFSTVIVGD